MQDIVRGFYHTVSANLIVGNEGKSLGDDHISIQIAELLCKKRCSF